MDTTESKKKKEEVTEDSSAIGFCFDSRLRLGQTRPDVYQISSDGKTATLKSSRGWYHILLRPSLEVAASGSGTRVVHFRVDEMLDFLQIGLTDDSAKHVYFGCSFTSSGDVSLNGEYVAYGQSFGGWRKGDRITLTADLGKGKVQLQAPNGKYTVDWKPRFLRAFRQQSVDSLIY